MDVAVALAPNVRQIICNHHVVQVTPCQFQNMEHLKSKNKYGFRR